MKLVHPGMDIFSSIKRKGVGRTLMLVRDVWCSRLAFTHPEGQALGLEILRHGGAWLIISVYAPNDEGERQKLRDWLSERVLEREVILVGDLNRGDEEQGEAWVKLSSQLQLVDANELANDGGDSGPTWTRT